MSPLTVWVLVLAFSGCAGPSRNAAYLPDEPESRPAAAFPFKAAGSYEQALKTWKTPEEISGWMAAHFTYDRGRAMRLSETQRSEGERLSVYEPWELFGRKSGVCVDLARFGVETLRRIDPESGPKYLLVEFDPVRIGGNTFRLHWLAGFKRKGKLYFFADSKRPGHIAGPYDDLSRFVEEYERYRGRRVVGFRELDSYRKQRRTPALPQQQTPANQG